LAAGLRLRLDRLGSLSTPPDLLAVRRAGFTARGGWEEENGIRDGKDGKGK